MNHPWNVLLSETTPVMGKLRSEDGGPATSGALYYQGENFVTAVYFKTLKRLPRSRGRVLEEGDDPWPE